MSTSGTPIQASSPSVTPDPTPWIPHDHVWIMHLSLDGSQVLMCESDGEWDFPYFSCRRSARVLLHECCDDYQLSLGIKSEQPCFTLLCELMGNCFTLGRPRHGLNRPGKVQLLWIEQHIPPFELPKNYAWKDLAFIQSLECDEENDSGFKLVVQRVIAALLSPSAVLKIHESRYKIGWHSEACQWLHQVVQRDGAQLIGVARQYRVSFTSTTLVVNSSKGWYFLKAPLAGSGEVYKTCEIAQVMPDDTLDIVGASTELAAFVSRGFKSFYEKNNEKEGGEYTSAQAVLKALASFQLRSIEYRDRLVEAGVPMRDLETFLEELRSLQEDEKFEKATGPGHSYLEEALSYVEEIFAKLKDFNIPMVLTHGDYGQRNFGFKKGKDGKDRMILFDWQFACISHPFFEFYDSFRMLKAGSEDDLKNYMDEYLKLWSAYEPLDRARDAFALAEPVGWLLRAVSNLKLQLAGQIEVKPPLSSFAMSDLHTTLRFTADR